MAKKRDVYHVTPSPGGGWDVKKEGGQRPSAHADKKTMLLLAAKSLPRKRH